MVRGWVSLSDALLGVRRSERTVPELMIVVSLSPLPDLQYERCSPADPPLLWRRTEVIEPMLVGVDTCVDDASVEFLNINSPKMLLHAKSLVECVWLVPRRQFEKYALLPPRPAEVVMPIGQVFVTPESMVMFLKSEFSTMNVPVPNIMFAVAAPKRVTVSMIESLHELICMLYALHLYAVNELAETPARVKKKPWLAHTSHLFPLIVAVLFVRLS